MPTLGSTPGLKIVLFLYLVLAFGYSILVPMWEAPDETAHYLYVLILAREGRLPTDMETHEALQPPGYYWPAAQLFRLLERIEPGLIRPYRPPLSEVGQATRYEWTADNYRPLWGARMLRWLNIIPGAFTLIFIYKGAKRLFPDSIIPFSAAALAGLTPQFLHNTAAITNDALGNLAGAVLFWLITVVVQERQKWWETVFIISAAVVLPFIIKLTIMPMSLVLLLAVIWRQRTAVRRYWPWLAGGSILLGLIFFGFLSLLVRQTDILDVKETNILVWRTIWLRATYIRPDLFMRHSFWFIFEAFSQGYWGRISYHQVGLSLILSLWLTGLAGMGLGASLGRLFNGNAEWRPRLFWFGLPILVIIGLGLLWTAGKTSEWWETPTTAPIAALGLLFLTLLRLRQVGLEWGRSLEWTLWGLLWSAAVITFLFVFKNTLSTPQYQGRFFFPALGPLSVLITAGWLTLLPRQLRPYLPYLILVLLLSLNLYVWYDQLIPIYYQPFLD